MKLAYKSKKWNKEISELNNAKKMYNGDYEISVKSLIYNFSETDFKDYCWFYGCLDINYGIVARTYFLDNDNKNVINNIYLSALSLLFLKRLYDNGVRTEYNNIQISLTGFEYAVCKLISVDCGEIMINFCNDSIVANLLLGNEIEAKVLVDELSDDSDSISSVYYNEPIFLKAIYKSILDRDENAFNENLAQRIKKYRKNMVGYSTIIDYTSIALIKVAKKYGLNCNINVIEIPDFFFEPINTEELLKLQLPFYDEVKKLL